MPPNSAKSARIAAQSKKALKPKGKKVRLKPRERKNLPLTTKIALLTEAGYRCAFPAAVKS